MTHSFPTRRSSDLPSKFNLGNVILMVRTKKLRKTDYHDLAELERSPLLADLRCNRDPRNCLNAHRQERQQIRLSRRRDDRPGRQGNEDHDHDGIRKERSEEHTSELQSLMRISYAVS